MFKKETKTIVRPVHRGYRAHLEAINQILNDETINYSERVKVCKHAVRAALATETVEVYEKVVG